MEIIITESQLPRIFAMNWLIKHTQDFRRVNDEKTIKVISNNGETVFEYDKLSNTLKIDYPRIWSYIYHQLRYDKDTAKLIIRAYAIDFLKLTDLKFGGKFKIEDLNNYSKEFKLNEDENPPTEPKKSGVTPPESKSLDMSTLMKRNPFLEKIIPQKENFLKSVANMSADEQLKRLTGIINQKDPNHRASVNNGVLNFDIKNPFVGQKLQFNNPIKIKGNLDIRLLPKPKIGNFTVNMTIPF